MEHFGFRSNNAPQVVDVLGTLLLSILCGHSRYAHINALRFDMVTPPILGMSKVVSEDSARRSLKRLDQIGARSWQQRHLRATWEPLLYEPWVLDIDTTIKTIYGHQQGAQVGYNPHKPGRPSHTYHTYWIGRLRLCLDVEVRPGKELPAPETQFAQLDPSLRIARDRNRRSQERAELPHKKDGMGRGKASLCASRHLAWNNAAINTI